LITKLNSAITKNTTTQNHQSLLLKMMEETDGYAIFLLDKAGNIATWNKGAEKIKGYKAEEIIGRHFSVFYPEEERRKEVPAAILSEADRKGTTFHESWRQRKDGTLFWGSITITALHDENNNVTGYAKVTRDLTEKMMAEITIKKHLLEVERKNKELEQFAYIASHDLQEPLLTITNFVELMQLEYAETLDENSQIYFEFINQAANRMKYLITGLLDYSRIGIDKAAETIDCNLLLTELQQDLSSLIKATGTTIVYDNLPIIVGYPLEIRQLFQNLITNAIKFRGQGTTPLITIEAVLLDKFWRFAVKDNGIGIEAKFVKKIFRLFKRLHTRDVYEGNGIGLAHCKKIIESHCGEIYVKSQPGSGSTFYFTIPIKSKSV